MKFSGIVKKYLGRGKELGFPTANLEAPKNLPDGLYLGWANELRALIFIGPNKTFGETKRRAEVYILDFDQDLYGQKLEVETIKKIRDVIKFDSKEALIEQMKIDEEVARGFFGSYNKPYESI